MAERASTRLSIRWPPEPASEPTDTLVLSVGDFYVDLRVAKADQSIEWALAGQTIVLSEEPLKIKFTYLIDSRCLGASDTDPEPDVGQFVKLPNGDDLETGEMAAPHLDGRVMPYEEVWRQLDASIGCDDPVAAGSLPRTFILEGLDHDNDRHERQDLGSAAETNTKSLYARVGRFYLALRRTEILSSQSPKGLGSYKYAAIRQDFDETRRRWVPKYQIGDLTGLWTMRDSQEEEGGKSGDTWRVGDSIFFGGGDNDVGEWCTVQAVTY